MVNAVQKHHCDLKKWVCSVIDGLNYSETKTIKSSLSKLDETRGYNGEKIDKEYFRSFLNANNTPSSKARPNSTQKQTSSQEIASSDASLMTINFFTAQNFDTNTSPSLSLETGTLHNTNLTTTSSPEVATAHAATSATITNTQQANVQNGQTAASNIPQAQAVPTANAVSPNQALATDQAGTQTSSETTTSTPQTPTVQTSQAPTPHISAQNLAAILKSPATPLTAADMNLIAQSTTKQAGTVATSTATNLNSALQIQTNTTQSGVGQVLSQTVVPQGASAQFLQSTKGTNTSNSANSGSAQTGTQAQNSQTPNTSSASQPNPATTAQAASVQTPSTSQAGTLQGQVLSGNDFTNFSETSTDTDLAELPETTLKSTNFTSSNTSSQPNPTTELPASLRSANPVTQQAWAGIIQRLDGKSQQFQIRLDPAELGRINVSIEITKDKKATVTLAAKSAEALSELSKGSRALQDALAEAGIELEEGGLKLELSPDDSSSFTFNGDDSSQTANEKDGISKDADSSNDQQSNEPYHITPELTAWSRMRVDLKA